MQHKTLLKKIQDPFDVASLAPIGYNFLISADIGPQQKVHEERVQKFFNHMAHYHQESNGDYDGGAVVSVPLASADVSFNDSLSSAIFSRKSAREFSGQETSFEALSFVLRLAAGIKSPNPSRAKRQTRLYPSGGAMYTVRLYVDVRRVIGISSGLYLFNPYNNCLDLINDRISNDDRMRLHNGAQPLETIATSNFELLLSTKPSLALRKYGEHGWKVILMEMGHLAQNLWLVGVGCGYSMYPCTSLNIAESEKILRTSAKGELLLHSLVVGIP